MPPKSPTSRLDFSRRAEGGPQNIPFKEIRQGVLPYEEVDFSGNSLSANELPEVIKICKRCPKLRVLKLFKNCIDDHGAQDLADLCRSAPGLEEIHLSHNMFTAAGATVIIKAAEEYRRPDTVPLWLRLEHNYIEDAERVFQNLQNRYSVCRRTDAKLCAARTCHHRCRVHLPHFCLQRLSQVESNQEPKRSPTHANQHSLFGQCMRKFRADLERENKDKVKIDSQMERMEMRAQPMGDPRVEPFDPPVDDRRPSWTREVSDQDPEDFAGFPAGPPRGPKQKEVHPEQLVDPDSCQEFVCMLCEGVIHDPTLTRCSHSFCSDCFQNWVMGRVRGHLNQTGPKAGSMQNIPCPQCGQGLRKCDIVPLHHARHAAALVLQRCWSNVRIRCIHHPQHFQHPFGYYAQQLSHHTGIECSWLGNLCDYVSHISNCPVQNYDNGDNWAAGGESHDGGEDEVAPVFAEDDICIVLYDYTPDNNPNKIALSEGDLVRVYRTASNGWTGGSVLGPDMQDVGEPGWFPTNLLDRYDERYWAEDNAGYTYEEQYGEHIGHGGELTDANHETHIEDYDQGFGDSSGEIYDDAYNQAKDKPYPESFEAHYNDFDKSYAQPVDKFGEPFEEYVEVPLADVNVSRPRQYSDPGGEQEYGDSPENAYTQSFEKQYGHTFDQPFDKRFVEPAEEAYSEPFSQPEKAFQQPFEKQLCEPYKSYNPSFEKHYGESLEKSYEDSYNIQCYDQQHYDQWYDDTYVQYGYTM